jgi:hypothetical protein
MPWFVIHDVNIPNMVDFKLGYDVYEFTKFLKILSVTWLYQCIYSLKKGCQHFIAIHYVLWVSIQIFVQVLTFYCTGNYILLHISRKLVERCFEYFQHKVMISVWGDRYAYPDLNIQICLWMGLKCKMPPCKHEALSSKPQYAKNKENWILHNIYLY